MSPLVTFLTTASRKASRLLYRDYFELEQIQSSVRPATDFALRSEKKVRELLLREILKYPDTSVVDESTHEIPQDLLSSDALKKLNIVVSSSERRRSTNLRNQQQDSDLYFIIHPIDGIENLTRAIPFFATIIVAYEYKNSTLFPIASIINSPALGEIIYSSKGSVLMERNIDQNSDHAVRLRASMTNKIEQAMVISDIFDSQTLFKQRSIGCDIYGAFMVACGKADVFLSDTTIDKAVIDASEMIVKEAGGTSYIDKAFNDRKYRFIASNGKILV